MYFRYQKYKFIKFQHRFEINNSLQIQQLIICFVSLSLFHCNSVESIMHSTLTVSCILMADCTFSFARGEVLLNTQQVPSRCGQVSDELHNRNTRIHVEVRPIPNKRLQSIQVLRISAATLFSSTAWSWVLLSAVRGEAWHEVGAIHGHLRRPMLERLCRVKSLQPQSRGYCLFDWTVNDILKMTSHLHKKYISESRW